MLNHDDERDLQRKIAKKLSIGDFNFQVGPSNYFCDIFDSYHNIYIEVKPFSIAPSQLLYGAVREFGNGSEYNFTPQIFGLANSSEVVFFHVPDYKLLKGFYDSIDSTGKTPPSLVKTIDRDKRALDILGEPFAINDYTQPLDLDVPHIFINQKNIFYVMARLEKYNIQVDELISKIADVHINQGQLTILKKGGIVNNVDGSVVASKPIKSQDVNFIQALRITPHDVTVLSEHLDTYKSIAQRRSLGKFFTKPHVSTQVHDIITKYINPEYIVEPYAGTGSLLVPFAGECSAILNDISEHEVEVARLMFEGYDFTCNSIDTLDYSAEELVKKWNLKSSDNALIFSNPPFGTSRTSGSSLHKDSEISNMKIKYRDELLVYGKGDLLLPAIGQMIEVVKRTGGYLAFFSPFGIMLGRKRYNKLLLELINNFTFLEGIVVSGGDFNEVSRDNPVAFTLWRLGGSTKHLDLKFDYNNRTMELSDELLLKEGWKYNEGVVIDELSVLRRDTFNNPNPGILTSECNKNGSRVIPDNVKKDISFET